MMKLRTFKSGKKEVQFESRLRFAFLPTKCIDQFNIEHKVFFDFYYDVFTPSKVKVTKSTLKDIT
jgi:hypothetical protein